MPHATLPIFCKVTFRDAGRANQGVAVMLGGLITATREIMKNKAALELADVKKIAAAAEAEALRNNWAVSIAVVDDGGHLLWLQRLDGASPVSAHIAPGKAATAALGRQDSKAYEDMINGGRAAFLSVSALPVTLEGGVVAMKDGQCVGAVGVSGVKSAQDAQIARAGLQAMGL